MLQTGVGIQLSEQAPPRPIEVQHGGGQRQLSVSDGEQGQPSGQAWSERCSGPGAAADPGALGRGYASLPPSRRTRSRACHFTTRVLSGNLRLLLGLVRANRSWRLAVRLSRALTATIAPGVVALSPPTSGDWPTPLVGHG